MSWRGLYEFWFRPQSARKVGLFRIAFGLAVLASELLYAGRIQEYFANNGFIPNALAQQMGSVWTRSLLDYVEPPLVVTGLFWLMVAATLAFTLGLWPRAMAAAMWVLWVSFHNRNPLLVYGGDRVISCVLFFCTFLQSDRAYTLPWYRRRQSVADVVPGWPVRLIQVQVAIMYFATATVKLGSSQWIGGTYLYGLFQNPNFALWHWPWLEHFGPVLALMGYGVLALELGFIFLVWWRQTNLWILAGVAGAHIGIALTMNATYFSEIMLAVLILCVHDDAWQNATARAKAWWRQRRASLLLAK